MSRNGIALLALLLAAGCGESVASFVAARRAAAEQQLARVAAVRELVRRQAPSDWATMEDPGPMAICDLVVAPHRDKGCDTWVVDAAQLDSPTRYLTPAVRYGQADWLVMTSSLLASGRYPPNDNYPQGAEPDRVTRPVSYAFGWLASLRYLIVVRSDEVVAPTLAPDQKSYTPGHMRGEALLFALVPEARALGSAPFSYQMAGEVAVKMRGGVIQVAELENVFARGVRQALADELALHLKQLERP